MRGHAKKILAGLILGTALLMHSGVGHADLRIQHLMAEFNNSESSVVFTMTLTSNSYGLPSNTYTGTTMVNGGLLVVECVEVMEARDGTLTVFARSGSLTAPASKYFIKIEGIDPASVSTPVAGAPGAGLSMSEADLGFTRTATSKLEDDCGAAAAPLHGRTIIFRVYTWSD